MARGDAGRGRDRRARARLTAVLPLAGLAAAGVAIFLVAREDRRRGEEIARAEAAQAAERRAVLASGELDAAYARCLEEWQANGVYVWPLALAYTRERLTVYTPLGVDATSWLQLTCDEEGARRGARISRPWLELLPAEAPDPGPGDEAATPANVVERLAGTSLAFDELAVEATTHPATGALVVRRWRGLEGGVRPHVEPADAPELPSLLPAAPRPLAPGVRVPTPLRELRRYRWAEESDAAFALLERSLPAGARLAELTLDDERIQVTIEWPTPGFDGDPPAPYGDFEWDAFAVADRDYGYPRETPGFGCPRGRPLAEVRAAFAEAETRLGGRGIARAWYSCSPAYSDGRQGVWSLVAR